MIIKLFHFLIILFVILVPLLIKSPRILILHALFVPLMVCHWKLNSDVCSLTELEKVITNKQNNKDTFIGSILGPVYEPKTNEILKISLFFWLITLYKLNSHFNLIK
jgi:hypothetical protein